MAWNRKFPENVRGVPLDDLMDLLTALNFSPVRHEESISLKQGEYESTITVGSPPLQKTADGRISAIVTVVTSLPELLLRFLAKPAARAAFNRLACLGSLYENDGRVKVVSRLTVFEGEDAWKIHIPLLCCAAKWGGIALMMAAGNALDGMRKSDSQSAWSEADFLQVEKYLSPRCVCSSDELGFTAECPLEAGEASAVRGDHHTALLQLLGDQPHPCLGGGLLALLEMPYEFDEARNDVVIGQLNAAEMAQHDLPPHFGAWCRGKFRTNPAYVTFLPNALKLPGIAVNLAVWAYARAQFANKHLAAMAGNG